MTAQITKILENDFKSVKLTTLLGPSILQEMCLRLFSITADNFTFFSLFTEIDSRRLTMKSVFCVQKYPEAQIRKPKCRLLNFNFLFLKSEHLKVICKMTSDAVLPYVELNYSRL